MSVRYITKIIIGTALLGSGFALFLTNIPDHWIIAILGIVFMAIGYNILRISYNSYN